MKKPALSLEEQEALDKLNAVVNGAITEAAGPDQNWVLVFGNANGTQFTSSGMQDFQVLHVLRQMVRQMEADPSIPKGTA